MCSCNNKGEENWTVQNEMTFFIYPCGKTPPFIMIVFNKDRFFSSLLMDAEDEDYYSFYLLELAMALTFIFSKC